MEIRDGYIPIFIYFSGYSLHSVSISFPSFVFLRNFNDLRLNDPPVFVAVPRLNKNGLTVATGLLCDNVIGTKKNNLLIYS